MNGRFLLDTNIVIAIFGEDILVSQQINQAEEVFIPNPVIGELYFGVYKSTRVTANLAQLEALIASNKLLACDCATAQQYGHIKNLLRVKGRPIPENDIWIAAVAMQYDLTLASRDEHFREVEGLSWEKW